MSRLIYTPAVFLPAYGALLVADAGMTQIINIAPAKMTGWTITSSSVKNLTVDPADDSITIVINGVYAGAMSIAYAGSANTMTEIHLRVDGVEQPDGLHRHLSGNDVGSASFQITPMSLVTGQVLTVYIEADADGRDFTPVDAQFSIVRIG